MEPFAQTSPIDPSILDAIYQSLPQPTFIWKYEEEDFYLIGFNRAASEFASNQIGQLVNKKASDIYNNDPEIVADLHNCYKGKRSFEKEINYKFKSVKAERYLHINYVYVNSEIIIVQPQEITEKKKLEQLLIASENRFHSLADNSLVGTFIIKNNVYSYVNKEFGNIFGYSIDEMIGKDQFEIFVEEDRAILQQYFAESVENEKSHSCEIRGIHKNNNIINIEFFGTRKIINDQEAILGALLNITERKKSENRLMEAQKATKVGSWETDLSTLEVYWSNETFSIFELDLHSFNPTHNSFLDYVHPEDKQKVDDAFKSSFASREYNIIQHRIITAKGKLKHVEERWRVSFNANNEPVRVFGTCQDITETIEYEEKLALSSLIVNSSHDAILSITLEGIITSWNKGAEKILGYNETEAIGKSIYMLIPEELHEEEVKISSSIQERKVIDRYETVRINKNGTIVHVSLTVSPIINEFNQVIGASKIMRDISVQIATEYEKAQIMNDLIQRNKDLEQFAYIVSHNLRAPVANIIGITNFMKMPDLEPSEQASMVSSLNQSVTALDGVIKDLSLILQIRREVNEQRTTIHFSVIMNEIQMAIDNLIKLEKVTFEIDFSAIDQINSIKSYIYSIFYNLISNSIKYRRPDVQPVIKIKSSIVDNQILLVFSDNGLGIDLKKNKDTVFGLYKRFHSHTEGKGMGLFMVKTQIETLGGKIHIASEPNKGTQFKIELPAE